MFDIEKLSTNIKFTSQIPFCSYCLSFDLYKGCPHRCRYCFAQTSHGERLKVGSKSETKLFGFEKIIKMVNGEAKGGKSYIQEFIDKKQPFHIGGMADPFPYGIENKTKHALSFINAIKEYPCIWSTKNPPSEYADEISRGNHILQFSCIGNVEYDSRVKNIEPGLPDFKIRIEKLKKLRGSAKKLILRFQPFIPFIWNYDNINRFLDSMIGIVDAVTIEFLKKPVGEKWEEFSKALNFDVNSFFEKQCEMDMGTDKVFYTIYRYEMLKLLRKMIKERGFEFYSAENYFRHLGDGPSCCGVGENDGAIFQSKLTYCLNDMLFKAKKEGSFCWKDIEKNMPDSLKEGKWVMGFDHALAKKTIRDVLKSRYSSSSIFSPEKMFINLKSKTINGEEHYFYVENKLNRGLDFTLSKYDSLYGNNILKDAKVI